MQDKISSAASYCTSGGLICGGVFQWLHGLDWNFIALICGICIAIATYITNLYFKRRQTRAFESALKRGLITAPPSDE
ncbi:phage holin [Izhakiella capsodis]|nr:phage holin [Izhakiella capsodis]